MSSKFGQHLTKAEYNKKYYQANNPYPVRLGPWKQKLQQDAFEQDKTIPEVLRKIISDHYEKNGKTIKEILEPLSKLK